MKILICGDRNWTNYEYMKREFESLKTEFGEFIVIQGWARGADQMAEGLAREFEFKSIGFPARWDLYGRAAGPKRKQQMLDEGKPDLVIRFHPYIENSKGTKDMIRRADQAGIPTRVITGR